MKALKSIIKKDSTKMVESMVEDIFNYLHNEYETTSGDMSPMQKRILENTKETLSALIAEQVFQNVDFTMINLNELTREELIELAYSLDWNGSWDNDEEGQEPITNEELIFSINNMIAQNF